MNKYNQTMLQLFETFFGPNMVAFSTVTEKDIDVTRTVKRIQCAAEAAIKEERLAFPRLGNKSREWVPGLVHIINILSRQIQDGMMPRLRDICDSALSLSVTGKFLDSVSLNIPKLNGSNFVSM